jgi:hypothetical protein
MVFLTIALKAKWNRRVNIVVGLLQIFIVVSSNFIGELWAYYIFGSALEVVLLSLIVWYAWTWPVQDNLNNNKRNNLGGN